MLFLLSPIVMADSLSGYVTDTTGIFVPNVTVAIYNSTGTINSTATNLAGFYQMSYSIPTGIYNISFASLTHKNSTLSKIIFSNSTTEVNVTLQPFTNTGVLIYGKATNFTDPLPNTSIIFQNSGVYLVSTNSSGEYSLSVDPGTYNITASKAGYIDSIKAITLNASMQANLNFTLFESTPAIISGIIINSTGQPMTANIQLRLGQTTIITTTSNQTGNFQVEVIPGTYVISSSKPGFVAFSQEINVTNNTEINVSLVETGTITGRITNGENATVILKKNSVPVFSMNADETGYYSITAGIGSYTVQVSKSGYNTEEAAVTLTVAGSVYSPTLLIPVTTTTITVPVSGGGSGGGTPVTTVNKTTSTTISTTTVPAENINLSEGKTSLYFPIIEGEKSISLADEILTDMKINVSSPAINTRIDIEKTDLPTGIPNPNGMVYQYLTVKMINLSDDNITNVAINFKVKKSWITGVNINENDVSLERYNGNWNKLPTSMTFIDDDYFYYKSVSPGLSVFAITGQKNQNQTETTTNTTISSTTTSTIQGTGLTGLVIGAISANYFIIVILAVVLISFFVLLKMSKRTRPL